LQEVENAHGREKQPQDRPWARVPGQGTRSIQVVEKEVFSVPEAAVTQWADKERCQGWQPLVTPASVSSDRSGAIKEPVYGNKAASRSLGDGLGQ